MTSRLNWTTLYYKISSAKSSVSMPIICQKTDKYALVLFKTKASFGTFRGYKTASGYKTIADAKAAIKKNPFIGIYKLSPQRPAKDTLIFRNF